MMDERCECTFFEEGDWVECKLNTDQFGIIISESDFGRYYIVQLAGSMESKGFHWATIRHMDDPEEEMPPAVAEPEGGNVVNFTVARDLRNSKTKGAA